MKQWKVKRVAVHQLEDALNDLSRDGYEIHTVDHKITLPTEYDWIVIAQKEV